MPSRPLSTQPKRSTPIAMLVLVLIALTLLPACTPYRREISRSGILTKLKDQQSGTRKSADPTSLSAIFAVPEGMIRVEDEDGNITLYAKSVKHLMNHIIYALQNNERDLFTEQILSQITKDEFTDRGLDPGIAFDELVKHKRSVYQVFGFMPMGERTPGLFLKPIGENLFRLETSRAGHKDALWIGIDVSFEQTNFKLRWFVR